MSEVPLYCVDVHHTGFTREREKEYESAQFETSYGSLFVASSCIRPALGPGSDLFEVKYDPIATEGITYMRAEIVGWPQGISF